MQQNESRVLAYRRRMKGSPMHASERWVEHFVEQLECAKCKSKNNLKLYNYDKTVIDPKKYTVDELVKRVPRMDVWCDRCGVSFNMFTTGPGRQKRKHDAAFIAQLASNANLVGVFDHYTNSDGTMITKRELMNKVKDRPCQVCGNIYPPPVMEFHHIVEPKIATVGSMLHHRYSLTDVIKEIEKCAVVCANCQKLLTYGLVEKDLETVVL